MQKDEIIIGLDLGTASVGWSILNSQNNEIIDMGVRRFSDKTANNTNQDRRNARARRRNIRRKQQLRTDFCNLLIKHRLVENKNQFQAIIKQNFDQPMANLKLLGLKSVLEPNQLIAILYHYLKHRGSFNQNNLETKVDPNEQKQKELANHLYDINKLPSENQILIKQNDSHIKGHPINYAITNQMWLDEIKQVLSIQKLDQSFVDEYLMLMQRRRAYWQGPGSEVAPSPYGRWEYDKSGKPLKFLGGNLWDAKIGKCTYYPDQNRHLKNAPISELFNFFNEISVFKFIDEDGNKRCLNAFEKQTILEQQFFSLAKITKTFKLQVDREVLKLKNELKTTKQLLKIWKQLQIDFNNTWDDYLQLDDVYQQISTKSELEERINIWKQLIKQAIDEEALAELLSLPLWKNGTASLSKYAMCQYVEWILNSDQAIEQMTYFNEHNAIMINRFEQGQTLDRNYFQNQSLPLVINNCFQQAIDVINAIIKKYHQNYNIKKIVIELARELNSESVKKAIEKTQRQKEKEFQLLLKEIGWNDAKTVGSKMKTKLLLWKQQNGIDLYDGQKIDLGDLKNRPDQYEVDHIIPYRRCFNDALINKTLTKATNNQAKGDKTPFEWLSANQYQALIDRLNKNEISGNQKWQWKQKVQDYFSNQNHCFDDKFLAAQLNDTRYFSKLLLNYLKNFFKYNLKWNQDEKVKPVIANLNGSLTNYVRYEVLNCSGVGNKLLKNRYIYSHHAIDAAILAWVANNYYFQKALNWQVKNQTYDQNTGALITNHQSWLTKNSDVIVNFKNQLDAYLDLDQKIKTIKFSRPLERKNNFQFANETLYSLKTIDQQVFRVTKVDLLKASYEELEKYFNPSGKYHEYVLTFNDLKLKNELLKIYEENKYSEYTGGAISSKKENPFVKYWQSEAVQNYLKKMKIDPQLNNDKIPLMWITKNGKPFTIRHISVREKSAKDLNKVMLNHKQGGHSCYESLSANKYRIYRDQTGNYVAIGLTILNQDLINGKSIVNEDKLKPMLERLNIVDHRNYYEFNKGSMLINKYNDLFYISGGAQAENKLAIKALAVDNYFVHSHTNWTDAPKAGKFKNGKLSGQQWQRDANWIVQNFKRCKVGILGEIKIIEW